MKKTQQVAKTQQKPFKLQNLTYEKPSKRENLTSQNKKRIDTTREKLKELRHKLSKSDLKKN